MAAGDQTRDLLDQLRTSLLDVTDEQTRDLVSAWVDAWNEVEPDLRATLLELLVAGEKITRGQMLRSERLRKVLALIQQQLTDLSKEVGVRVAADLQQVIDTAGAAQASIIDSQLPPDAPQLVDLDVWSRVDPRQIAAIVKRTTQQITSRRRPLSAEAYAAVRAELVRGISAGSNPRITAARIVKRAEGAFNGGLSRALTIARTETIDAHRAAAAAAQAEQVDVLAGWIWGTNLRPNTCPACFGMDGTFHGLDEPGPLGHQNCRCSRIPKVKSWAELGFDIEEPPEERQDPDEYFEALSKDEQVAILGQRGWDAWKAGQYPREKWAVRKTSDGWRDAYYTAKPPEPEAKNGAELLRRPKSVPGEWVGKSAPTPGEVTRVPGIKVKPHELVSSFRLASLGENVHWLSNPGDRKTPDVAVRKVTWEIKAPTGSTIRTVRQNLEIARGQSERAILDLYRSELRGDLDTVREAIDSYWGDATARGAPRLETIWVLTENVQDHFTLEYKTWLTQR